MKPVVSFVFRIIFIALFCLDPLSQTKLHSADNQVYICVTGKVYHATDKCSGLRNAKHKIIKVSLEEAINKYERRPCKICY